MPSFTKCPVCSEAVDLSPHLTEPYTTVSCVGCGNYSLHNGLVAELLETPEIAPPPEAFRTWLAKKKVDPSLESQGPLITAGTFKLIRKKFY